MRKKFMMTLKPFMAALASIGVRVSPAARSTEPKMMEAARKSIGIQMMLK